MEQIRAILYAFLAAVFYAINVPVSKLLLRSVGPTTMAAFLYLGAGIGIGLLSLLSKKEKAEKLSKEDLPYVLGMIGLGYCGTDFSDVRSAYGFQRQCVTFKQL